MAEKSNYIIGILEAMRKTHSEPETRDGYIVYIQQFVFEIEVNSG